MAGIWPVLFFLMQDPSVSAYLNRVSHKLAPIDVTFQPDAKVHARPDASGVLISSGLFSRTQNEAEIAGVLAHEIGHTNLGTPCIRLDKTNSKEPNDREREHAADQTAIAILTRAGYNPSAMLEFFSRYRRENAEELPKGYSTEDLLLEKLQLEATDHPLKNAITNTSEFDRVHSSGK